MKNNTKVYIPIRNRSQVERRCVACKSKIKDGDQVCNECLNRKEHINKKKLRVYIAGKITGLPESIYKQKFNQVENQLNRDGHLALNPIKLVHQDLCYEEQMELCLSLVKLSNVIYMMDNWKESNGARKEYAYAVALDKKIVYQAAD